MRVGHDYLVVPKVGYGADSPRKIRLLEETETSFLFKNLDGDHKNEYRITKEAFNRYQRVTEEIVKSSDLADCWLAPLDFEKGFRLVFLNSPNKECFDISQMD